jgi:molybdenum cofactor sulfurtransferase
MAVKEELFDDDYFNHIRQYEYGNLDLQGQIYLDHTGGNLYPKSILEKHHSLLSNVILGNPHSTNPTSVISTGYIEEARSKVLEFFNASDYTCVFTQNASAALKIVGESYPFDTGSTLVLLSDNHNSVNGIREYCNRKGGRTVYSQVQYEDLMINEETLKNHLCNNLIAKNNLFAFPAQSNVSGVKHDLKWIEYAHERGWDVLLDAAAFVPTSKLDLKIHQPDYVSVSFYKIFGYPTGIGCLLIKNSAYAKLVKPWFAGGTVTLVSVISQEKFLTSGHERFEDGTLNYTNLPAISFGIDYIKSIGIEKINKRVQSLITYVTTALKKLHHDNGLPVVKIFGPDTMNHRGGNIVMNFLDIDGEPFPFQMIEEMANEKMISIRSGCFCNPGIDEINNCITNDEISKYFMSRDQGDYFDMIHFLHKMRGATRLSVGIATNTADLDKFVELISQLINRNYDLPWDQ